MGSGLSHFTFVVWLTQSVYPHSTKQDDSIFAITALGLTSFLPRIIISPIAGVWVDRLDRKSIMLFMDLMQGCISFVMFILLLNNGLSLWTLLCLIAGMSLLSSFHNIAFDSSYIMIVPEQHLPRANAMMQTIWTVTGVVSPALAATIISLPSKFDFLPLHDGVALAIDLDALTFFIAGFCLTFLKIPSPDNRVCREESTINKSSFINHIKFGITFLLKYPSMLWLVILGFITNVVYSSDILIPIVVKEILEEDWISKGWNYS
ncbi:Major Facilitator Superfamily protein [Lihuaxuella thermophila]|uniref:Major Facilitator Superfamily protein n=1 Tax=Lihuaxuella thermophila TaxID=1173111 RepID=A0A1H8GYH6_9BACL|nr:Major Facilitator Superfamily protein [Lihuaxuella thermophila]